MVALRALLTTAMTIIKIDSYIKLIIMPRVWFEDFLSGHRGRSCAWRVCPNRKVHSFICFNRTSDSELLRETQMEFRESEVGTASVNRLPCPSDLLREKVPLESGFCDRSLGSRLRCWRLTRVLVLRFLFVLFEVGNREMPANQWSTWPLFLLLLLVVFISYYYFD